MNLRQLCWESRELQFLRASSSNELLQVTRVEVLVISAKVKPGSAVFKSSCVTFWSDGKTPNMVKTKNAWTHNMAFLQQISPLIKHWCEKIGKESTRNPWNPNNYFNNNEIWFLRWQDLEPHDQAAITNVNKSSVNVWNHKFTANMSFLCVSWFTNHMGPNRCRWFFPA